MDFIGELFKIALTAGLSIWGTIHLLGRSSERDTNLRKEERDRLARYLAIRVVTALDSFVTDTFGYVLDDGMPDVDGRRHPESSNPSLTLPNDVDWKAIEPNLMYQIMALPNEIAFALEVVAFYADEGFGNDDDDHFKHRKELFSKIGLKALDLGDVLRRDYQIPPRDFGARDLRKQLQDAPVEFQERLANRLRRASGLKPEPVI